MAAKLEGEVSARARARNADEEESLELKGFSEVLSLIERAKSYQDDDSSLIEVQTRAKALLRVERSL